MSTSVSPSQAAPHLVGSQRFHAVQAFMREQRIDGWLIFDFRGSNPVLASLLPAPRPRFTTRRAMLYVPAEGRAVLLAHTIDTSAFANVPPDVQRDVYLSWQDLRDWLSRTLAGVARVAMEYVPGGSLPVVSIVDAGTIELVRSCGAEVCSSANLVQICAARWDEPARQSHATASEQVTRIKDAAFDLIRQRISRGMSVTERDVQQQIMSDFSAAGLETPDPPIVAVNEHSGDPHFEVSTESPALVRPGDWVLIDLWARLPGDQNIFSDITWVGFAGKDVPPKHRSVFEAVKMARDTCVRRAEGAWKSGEPVQGWQLDQAARDVLIGAGFEAFIRHRTGHSLSPGPKVHGMGVNIDNLETRDTRLLLPGIGFTIEPGLYLPEFGVRLEINAFVDEQRGPVVTSCVQDDVVLLM